MENNFLHKDFKLNGSSFPSVDALLDISKINFQSIYPSLSSWYDGSDFIEVFTSGSTGKPKLINLRKRFMVNSAIATGAYFDLPAKTTALLCMSTNYIAGKMMLVRAIILGWQLDLVEPSSNPLEGIKKNYDFSAMVPLQLFHSLGSIYKIKKLIVGGGAVSNDLQNKIQNVNTEIFATYGMTETITHIAVKRLNNLPLNGNTEHYKVLVNIGISIDSRGCLVIDAPNITDHQIITNDLVEIISDQEFKWLGRYDHIINSGGVKLIPEQIEEKLAEIIGQRYFITSKKDPSLGESVVLIVEGVKFDLDPEQFRSVLSKFEIPKKIYFVDRFKETKSDKIDRKSTVESLF